MFNKKAIDTEFVQKYIWKKIYDFIKEKNLIISEVAKKMNDGKWYSHTYLLWILNAKNTTLNLEKYEEIANVIWMPLNELEQIVITAKKEEMRHTHWLEVLNWYLDKEDVDLELILRNEWILDEEIVRDIIKYIEFRKQNPKT